MRKLQRKDQSSQPVTERRLEELLSEQTSVILEAVDKIRGWLREGYNPVGFRMKQVFSVGEQEGKLMSESERSQKKQAFEIPAQDPLIRSIEYLINEWQTAGAVQRRAACRGPMGILSPNVVI